MNASWPQTKTIWSICVKIKSASYSGPAVDPQFWRKRAEDGSLSRDQASEIITAFLDKDSDKFYRLVSKHESTWNHNVPAFEKARRWQPKTNRPKAAPEPKGFAFKVGDVVRFKDSDSFHPGKKADVVRIFASHEEWEAANGEAGPKGGPEETLGVSIEGWRGGHNLNGHLSGTEAKSGWYINPDRVYLEVAETGEAKAESVEPAAPEPEEDEFSRKLRELEEAHRREKERAAKKKALEQFKVESIEYVKPDIFDDVCAMIKAGVQVCLVGPSGCGKSLLVTEISKVLKRSLYMESFAGGKRYSQIFGSTTLVDGKSEWTPAKFLKELQVENNIVFMDEIMSADADVLIGANPILDRKTRCFHSPIGVIAVAKTCTICAASNVTGREFSMNYKGTQQQDASILNRFVHIHMAYDDGVERQIVESSPLEAAAKSYLLTNLKTIRSKISINNISYDPSTRKLVQAIELIVMGLPKEKAFEYSFLTPLSQVERKKIEM